MDKMSKKWPKTIKYVSIFGIYLGFIGMAAICFELCRGLIISLIKPQTAASVALVLPFETGLKGTVSVPFIYWILSIFIIAVVHEFAHGVVARNSNIKVKSSGFAFMSILLPIIPAAFVEPDEKQMSKKSVKEQLAVLAAGPFANIVLSIICLLIVSFAFSPLTEKLVVFDGVKIVEVVKDQNNISLMFPAQKAGIEKDEIIRFIDNQEITTITNFTNSMAQKKPGQVIQVVTNKSDYMITLSSNPTNATKAYIGVSAEQSYHAKEPYKKSYPFLLPTMLWLSGLFTWLFILNIGIGLFNLVPIGPVDGGRMTNVLLLNKFGKKKGQKIWNWISLFFLAVILATILLAFLK